MSQIDGITPNVPAGFRIPGEGNSRISGKERLEGETQLSEGDTDSEEDHLDWWGCRVCEGCWRTTGRIGWEESREEGDRNREEDRNFILCSVCRGEWWEPRSLRDHSSPTGER